MSYMPQDAFPERPELEQNYCLITEELCRVMVRATRFMTCIEAWQALLTVRRIYDSIKRDTSSSILLSELIENTESANTWEHRETNR